MLLKSIGLAAFASAAAAQEISNLIGILYTTPELSNFSSYLGRNPEWAGTLSQMTNITILAPSNEAFAKLENSSVAASLATDDALTQALLSYHVLNGSYPATYFTNISEFIPTLLDSGDYANVTGGQVVEALLDGGIVTFYSGLFGNTTVSNASTSINFSAGVIHIVDTVLQLPVSINETATAANLTSVWGGLNTTGLLSTVDSLSDLTLFIPSNEAVHVISPAISYLSVEDIAAILQYHVVNATGFSMSVPTTSMTASNMTASNMTANMTTMTTPASSFPVGYSTNLMNSTVMAITGENLTITVYDMENIFVNSARILVPNVLVANGVIHIIDNVLNPQDPTATPVFTMTGSQMPAYSSTANSSDTVVPFTSGVPTPTSSIAAVLTETVMVTNTETAVRTTGLSSTSKAMAPMKTGAMGAAALFGGAVLILNV